MLHAPLAELADALVLGTSAERREGSNPLGSIQSGKVVKLAIHRALTPKKDTLIRGGNVRQVTTSVS
jgi:hypothetical protein